MPRETATPELLGFWNEFSRQAPQKPCLPHELILARGEDGVRTLRRAPASDVRFGKPPTSSRQRGENTYIWVIDDRGIPYIIERSLQYLGGNAPKHTNLTGGQPAYIGGEMWFSDNASLYLSGGSGRYPPIHEGQLNDAARVFESYDYHVASLGWDSNTDEPRRIYRAG